MLKSNRIVALDIGASKIVLAEFDITKDGDLELINYGISQIGGDPKNDIDSSAYIVTSIREVMRNKGIKPAPLFMTVSGKVVFPRYVKLPPVTPDKIDQIIQYEAEQNVPFPIDEVVFDYQLLGGEDDLDVMLVAVKTENIDWLMDCVQAIGMEPEIVDVAPIALYNAVRYNYPDLDGCTMILDIGARSSNLVFLEEKRVFTRNIPTAGNTITQEIMKEFNISFEDAEELKIAHSFVSFGGVYAGPDSDVADRVSKIVRNIFTRLHAEVNRSVNFYRSQQNGSQPSMVFLAGGSSVISHTDTFFNEKLKVPVEYLNPFVNISVGDKVDESEINEDIHLLGEVSGLALRRAITCPMEINLMPPDLVAKKIFRRRQPFFALTSVGIVFIMLCWWGYFQRMQGMLNIQLNKVHKKIVSLQNVQGQLIKSKQKKSAIQVKVENMLSLVALQSQWIDMIESIHSCMLEGMWLTSVKPVLNKKGEIYKIEIIGKGFDDKLKPFDKLDTTAVEVFRNRLKASKYFTEKTGIVGESVISTESFAREFTIHISLEKPIKGSSYKGGDNTGKL